MILNTKYHKNLILVFLMFLNAFCFAAQKKNSIDETLDLVSKEIVSRCSKNEIVAVLNFSAETKEMDEYVQNGLTASIFENSTLQVVTRQNMDKVEKELKFQNSGLVSDNTALSIGERLGAHKIIFGSLEELDNRYILQIKMLNVEKGAYVLFKKYEISRSSKTEQLLHHAATIYKSSLGFIFEGNKNSILGIAPAAGFSFDYSIFRRFSVGLKVLVSYDFFEKDNSIYSVEPLGFMRWYAVSPTGEPSAGLFVEAQGGLELIFVNSDLKNSLDIGGAVGFRMVSGNFYVEPILRGGYPYIFGLGINAGFRF